ncbi:hypothetical protein CDAR_295501 [Caerostris darwini]|uniref:Uncharacterized protein n=1 Tax=Caerostris darwini TaxID=1538125 RepID=A0AAV4ND08_9ARAC|nr:hypothetical protein CDAR_295501 [Caerostris darwini]
MMPWLVRMSIVMGCHSSEEKVRGSVIVSLIKETLICRQMCALITCFAVLQLAEKGGFMILIMGHTDVNFPEDMSLQFDAIFWVYWV